MAEADDVRQPLGQSRLGADEAYRTEFQAKRKPDQRRTATNVGVDTYRPLIPSPEFTRMAG